MYNFNTSSRSYGLAQGLVFTLTLILVNLIFSGPARAFRLTGSAGPVAPNVYPLDANDEHQFHHWDLRQLPDCELPWSRGAGTADIAGDAEWIDVVAAFETWSDVTPSLIDVLEVIAPADALPALERDKNNIVDWGGGLGVATLALTATWFNVDNGQFLEADTRFNDDDYTWVSIAHNLNQGGNPDVRTVMTHEAGHALGLSHPSETDPMNPPGPIMNGGMNLNGNANHVLGDDDEDGLNFLYNQDLGDAPDPCIVGGPIGFYPSLVHGEAPGDTLNGFILDTIASGASHIFGIRARQPARNYTYEWLGGAAPDTSSDVDSECEANIVDRDAFDDGLSFFPNPPMWGRPVTVTATINVAQDAAGAGHDYDSGRPLYWNVWFDRNQDCEWDDTGFEHVIHDSIAPADTTGANLIRTLEKSNTFLLPNFLTDPSGPTWLRTRIDWGEDSGLVADVDRTLDGPEGAAQFGEVEDYILYCPEPVYQNWMICTPTVGNLYRGAAGVTTGDMTGGGFFFADVDAEDCVLSSHDTSGLEATYDATADVTTVVYEDPETPIPDSQWTHIGLCPLGYTPEQGAPPILLQSYMIPEVGEPTSQDWVPSVYGARYPYDAYDRLLIGTPDTGSGGFIGDRGSGGAWGDTLQVSVSYWITQEVVPLPNLSPCDPLLQQMEKVFVGVGIVTPESPFVFRLDYGPDYQPDDLVILEIETSWSTNEIVSLQMVEFLGESGQTTDVPEGSGETLPALQLQAFPNPTAEGTALHFVLPQSGRVSLGIYDVQGGLVRRLIGGELRPAGSQQVWWDGRTEGGRAAPSGIYYTRLESEEGTRSRRIVLSR